jgi:ubiquinone/menaquinone biosynthesis C-methylase UbiE
MPDIYASVRDVPRSTLESIASILEIRAADPQQVAMRTDYLASIQLPPATRVLEVGCGTGPVTRALAKSFPNSAVLGIDPSPLFIEQAVRLADGQPNLDFRDGDAAHLPLPDATVDLVVFHTTLCHIPDLQAAMVEAHRVLRPAGALAIFDADYSSTNVGNAPADPLQASVAACVEAIVHDPYLTRKLVPTVTRLGFTVQRFRTHSYHGVSDATYLLTIIDRGADALAERGTIGQELAEALKTEARRRVRLGTFYGHLTYASLVATK